MNRVLLVAYYFPPVATSGAMRPLGFCRYLEQYGWRPRVLTTNPSSIDPAPDVIDEGLCSRLPSTVAVDSVPHSNPLRTLINTRNMVRHRLGMSKAESGGNGNGNGNGHSANGNGTRAGQLRQAGDRILNRVFAFPDSRRFWFGPAVRRATSLPASERPDVVFATGPPFTSLLVGRAIARTLSIPLVIDFRDPWAWNPYRRGPATTRLERSICHEASRIVTNTVEMRQQFVNDYLEMHEKFLTITNGYDPATADLADAGIDHSNPVPAQGARDIELCHFGTMYGQRNPAALFQAVKELADEGALGAIRFIIRFVGTWEVSDPESNRVAAELEHRGLIRREPPVSHAACLRQMRSAKTLLLLQTAAPLQVPAKIFEYISSGRPLLIIGDRGATTSLVERHRLGHCCINERPLIKELLGQLVDGRLKLDPTPAREMALFKYPALTQQLASVFDCVHQEAREGRR